MKSMNIMMVLKSINGMCVIQENQSTKYPDFHLFNILFNNLNQNLGIVL